MIEPAPAIDIIDGKCVRLSQGRLRQQENIHRESGRGCQIFEANGIRRLHVVDLDGRPRIAVNYRTLEQIATYFADR